MSRAVLLVNLGTPRSPSVQDVRRYLNEFLMDPHVLNLPWPARRLIVSGFILPFRPRRSAAAYASIWGGEDSAAGSPLLRHTEALGAALDERIDAPCAVAMRYGEPSIAGAVQRLAAGGCTELLLVPLFPQHADSTRTTVIEAVRRHLPTSMKLDVLPPFYDRKGYIDCQADLIERHLPPDWDHLLLSYHGLPERHITQADPTGAHCLGQSRLLRADIGGARHLLPIPVLRHGQSANRPDGSGCRPGDGKLSVAAGPPALAYALHRPGASRTAGARHSPSRRVLPLLRRRQLGDP